MGENDLNLGRARPRFGAQKRQKIFLGPKKGETNPSTQKGGGNLAGYRGRMPMSLVAHFGTLFIKTFWGCSFKEVSFGKRKLVRCLHVSQGTHTMSTCTQRKESSKKYVLGSGTKSAGGE